MWLVFLSWRVTLSTKPRRTDPHGPDPHPRPRTRPGAGRLRHAGHDRARRARLRRLAPGPGPHQRTLAGPPHGPVLVYGPLRRGRGQPGLRRGRSRRGTADRDRAGQLGLDRRSRFRRDAARIGLAGCGKLSRDRVPLDPDRGDGREYRPGPRRDHAEGHDAGCRHGNCVLRRHEQSARRKPGDWFSWRDRDRVRRLRGRRLPGHQFPR